MNFFPFTGTTSIKSTILKDGHNFTVHILDPKEGTEETDADEDMPSPANEKAEFEKSEKDGKLQYFLYCSKNHCMVLASGLMMFLQCFFITSSV